VTGLSLPEKVTALHHRLEEAKVAHAFGGALALAYYAEPRATIDIDVNVFVPPADHEGVLDALAPLGVGNSVDRSALERDGQCRLWWGRNPVDLFFANHPIHDEMRRDARVVPFGDETLPILAPEHLAVCKALFDRPKDWLDIEQMLVATEHIDAAEIADWLTRSAGAENKRTQRFDRLVEELRGT
jgi:hypothetical protein